MPGSAVRMNWSTSTKPRSTWILVLSMPTLSVRGARPTATSTFSASSFCCLPSTVKVTATPLFVFSTFSTLALTKPLMPRLRYTRISSFETLFVFDGHIPRQHFEDGHIRAERLIDAGELYAHRARADHDQRLGNLVQAEHFDVGQDLHRRAVVPATCARPNRSRGSRSSP